MPKYNVLVTCEEYIEMDGENAKDAEWKAYQEYKKGSVKIEPSLFFVCEEADLIEDEEDA